MNFGWTADTSRNLIGIQVRNRVSNATGSAATIALPLEQVTLIIVAQVVVTMALIAKSVEEVGSRIQLMVQQKMTRTVNR